MKTFSVKNFERFQHYKDRAPPWIKLYNELLDDYEFGRLPDASKMHLIAIWLLASRSENKIPYDPTWVARRINANTKVDLDLLAQAGFILLDQELQTMEQGASKPIAQCLSREEGEERQSREDIRVLDSKFEEFWKSLPRRDGANPKEPAKKLFVAAVKSGEDPDRIIAGARQCARLEAKNANTPYIPQAVKWLRDKRWQDYGALAEAEDAPLDWDAIIKLKAKIGVWSKHAGPEPGQINCRAPADLLQKYGLIA